MVTKKLVFPVKTAYGIFSCIFEHEKDMGGYTAEVTAVRGAVSWGKTLAEAKCMIAETIEGVIESRIIARAEQEGTIRVIRPAREKLIA